MVRGLCSPINWTVSSVKSKRKVAKKQNWYVTLEKATGIKKRFLELWSLIVATIFSGYLAFYFLKMLKISYEFQERSEGADEILIWIPQTSLAIGSTIFFISVFHQFILKIKEN